MKYVVLFRGLNVGGKSKVKMAELDAMLTSLGYQHVKTYIQSGNVLLEAEVDEPTLVMQISQSFRERFGFESAILARTLPELRALIDNLPFDTEQIAQAQLADPEVEHLYVYFVQQSPKAEQLLVLQENRAPGDMVYTGAREIYLLCIQSVRLSKTAIKLAKLFPDATARNWNTVNKLLAMLLEA